MKSFKFVFFLLYSSIKLGVIEDNSNRTRLAKLLRFHSSNSDTETTSLADYVERMKEKQESIFFMAGGSRSEVSYDLYRAIIILAAIKDASSQLLLRNLFHYRQGEQFIYFNECFGEIVKQTLTFHKAWE